MCLVSGVQATKINNLCLNGNAVVDAKISFSRLAQRKKAEFMFINEHFFRKRNDENGVFGQTLSTVNFNKFPGIVVFGVADNLVSLVFNCGVFFT